MPLTPDHTGIQHLLSIQPKSCFPHCENQSDLIYMHYALPGHKHFVLYYWHIDDNIPIIEGFKPMETLARNCLDFNLMNERLGYILWSFRKISPPPESF